MGALAAALSVPAGAWAAKWDMPVRSNERNHFTQNVAIFAKDIDAATQGELKLTIHPEDSLIKQQDLKRAIQTGQVPIGEFLMSLHSNENPIFGIDSLPFLATNLDENAKLLGVVRPYLVERLSKQGLRLLFAAPWPGNSLYSQKELNSLYDLKGTKFRAFNPVTGRLAELVGATPVTVQQSEISQAFSTGVIDAMITSPATGIDMHVWDYVKHYTDVAAMSPWNLVVVNERIFSKLSDTQKSAVQAAALAAEERAWKNAGAISVNLTKVLQTNGIIVKEPNDKMRKEITALREVFIKEWLQKAGDEGTKIVEAYRSAK
ncbi:TRAP transporter substrate-binding protein [Candidimonas sp. SYP-B2681]|uniref:TRAP transporter substrate-binding protein n=1 Tax=Candidimonas sp. SYP-B2681 TaxID=2497686 RepID=UPI001315A35B|nr:TRAP transporter substrate-binding protein [Candidimonas sp. SYP-B2681]